MVGSWMVVSVLIIHIGIVIMWLIGWWRSASYKRVQQMKR
jgi:hypothetical protein